MNHVKQGLLFAIINAGQQTALISVVQEANATAMISTAQIGMALPVPHSKNATAIHALEVALKGCTKNPDYVKPITIKIAVQTIYNARQTKYVHKGNVSKVNNARM